MRDRHNALAGHVSRPRRTPKAIVDKLRDAVAAGFPDRP